MATPENLNTLLKHLNVTTEFKAKDLVTRTAWGEITFEESRLDLTRAFDVASYLNELPLEYLPETAATGITQSLERLNTHLKEIDSFSISQDNPPQVRNQIVKRLRGATDEFYTQAAQWIPFLAYQQGDVAQNISDLSAAVSQAKGMLDNAQSEITEKNEVIQGIIEDARTAAAKAGAAVFTEDFREQSEKETTAARKWLRITGILAFGTIAFALVAYYTADPTLSGASMIQKGISKIGVLAVFFSATIWCGHIYRATAHQAAANNHRALSLKTLEAFVSAAREPGVKDAVVFEATKSIFGLGATGLVETPDSSNTTQSRFVDVIRSPAAVSAAARAADSTQ